MRRNLREKLMEDESDHQLLELQNQQMPVQDGDRDNDFWLADFFNMAILLILYTLQGIPMGLSGSIPLLMKERGASYEGLSLFSLVSVPFSLKLVWAPIVDSVFFPTIGRRKTWLVPVQLICGFVMIYAARHMNEWLGDSSNNIKSPPNVKLLTGFFMFLYFLMATQDVAVDGWALTILSRKNVGYASICNSIGQAFGSFIANQGFIALSDPVWCHNFLGTEHGKFLFNLSGFMNFWGYVFVFTTIAIWMFKKESPIQIGEEPEGITSTYRQVIAIFKSKQVQMLCLILLTARIGSVAIDSAGVFKMQEYGMPKADIASISPVIMVIQIVLPAFVSPLAVTKPLSLLYFMLIARVFTTLLSWAVIQWVPFAYASSQSPSFSFYAAVVAVSSVHQITGTCIFVGMLTFFAKISDPTIGGTYMTLLNTVSNLGYLWMNSFSLWLLPKISFESCYSNSNPTERLEISKQSYLPYSRSMCTKDSGQLCQNMNGKCLEEIDSYSALVIFCLLLSSLWLFAFRKIMFQLQDIPYHEWWVSSVSPSSKGNHQVDIRKSS